MKYENKTESHDITIDLKDAFLEDGKVFLDPYIVETGLINILKKERIIRDVCSSYSYGYTLVPIVRLNMGILKKYDRDGILKHLEIINKVGNYE